MVFIRIAQQSNKKIDKAKYDNINTYEKRSDVPDSDKVEDRLFYITSERTYCWDTFTGTFEVAFDGSIDVKGLSDEMLMLKGKQILMDSAVNGNTSSINTLDSRLNRIESKVIDFVGDKNVTIRLTQYNEYEIGLKNTLSGLQSVQASELHLTDGNFLNYITIGSTDLTFYENGQFVD